MEKEILGLPKDIESPEIAKSPEKNPQKNIEEILDGLKRMRDMGVKQAEVEYEPYKGEGVKKIKVGLENADIGDKEVIFSAMAKKEGEEKETVEIGKVTIKIRDFRGIKEIEQAK